MNDDDSILEPRSVTKFYGDFKAVDGKSTSKQIV